MLDLSTAKLSFITNEDKSTEYIVFKDIVKRESINYRLSVQIPCGGYNISIQSFEMEK